MKPLGNIWRNAPWALLIVAALMLRVLVPQGYMLGEDTSGGIEISLCNSGETWVIPMKDGGTGSGPHDDEPEADGKACSFAGNSAPATAPENSAQLPLPQLALAPYDAVRERALAPASVRVLPPARAPPILV